MTPLLDTHCHLDQYPSPPSVLADARLADIEVVAVTDNPDDYRRLRTRLGAGRAGVSVALGLHPASAAAAAPGQLSRFFRMLGEARWIGEVGLDYAPGTSASEKRRQRHVFESILGHDQIQSKILTVHSRGAAIEAVAALSATKPRAVLHWFTGSPAVAEKAADAGMWFSINSAMVRSPRGRELIAGFPRDRVLCETDGPYCRVGRRPAVPTDIAALPSALSGIWKVDVVDANSQLARNTEALLASE